MGQQNYVNSTDRIVCVWRSKLGKVGKPDTEIDIIEGVDRKINLVNGLDVKT